MLALLRKLSDVARAYVDTPVKNDEGRSPFWPKLRAEHLKGQPACRACGCKDHLEVHHLLPVHLHPELEMDPSNLITLCEKPSRNCHLNVGHAGDWKSYCPDAVQIAALLLGHYGGRKYT